MPPAGEAVRRSQRDHAHVSLQTDARRAHGAGGVDGARRHDGARRCHRQHSRRVSAADVADARLPRCRAFTSARISIRYRTPVHSTACSARCWPSRSSSCSERSDFHLRSRSSDSPTRKACGSARRFSAAARWPARSIRRCSIAPTRRGRSLRDAIRQFGLDPNRIPDAQAPANALGYLEFHIEQGPVLENLNLPLAVVDVISGQSRAELTFDGVAGHAGTTPMKMRKDALACAAAWIAEVEREALATSGLVATVGRIAVEPGAGNVVPGRAVVSLDVRHPADRMRKAAAERLSKAAEEIATRRGVKMTCEPRLDQPSVAMDAAIAAMLDRALEQSGAPAHRMSSGAGHDAMIARRRRCRPACCSFAAREASAIILPRMCAKTMWQRRSRLD